MRKGECVVVYPEGTLTRDPALWPMTGKSGAARIALETGCPVIPVGQWGAQQLLPPYAKRPHLFPRKHVTLKAGDPVDLSDLVALPRTPEVVQQATDRIMGALTELVAEIRGEAAPAERFDPRRAGVRPDRQPEQEGTSMSTQGKVAIFSAGSWGTAFSMVLADAGNDVTLWARREEVAQVDQRAAREPRLPAGHRAAAVGLGHPRRGGGPGRRRHGGAGDPVAVAARQPRPVGAVHPSRTR